MAAQRIAVSEALPGTHRTRSDAGLTQPRFDSRRIERLLAGRDHAPAELLGPSIDHEIATVLVHLPNATAAELSDGTKFEQSRWPGLFSWRGPVNLLPRHYRVVWRDGAGNTHSA